MDITGIDEIDDLLILFTNDATTSLFHNDPVAGEFALQQNYPNPFNPSTSIKYYLPQPALVSIQVFDVQGRLVQTLLEAKMPAGDFEVNWNGSDDRGSPVSSGIYFYRLEANPINSGNSSQISQTRKMVFIEMR